MASEIEQVDPAERYARWLVENKAKRGTPEFETVANAYKAARAAGSVSIGMGPASGGATIEGRVYNKDKGIVYDPKSDATENLDPTEGMGAVEKYRAGIQSKAADYGLGLGQVLDLYGPAEADRKRKLDAPLNATTAGHAGRITGALVPAVVASAVPGANTVAGSAIIGGALGGAEPVGTGESRTDNVLGGAAAGAGGLLLGRGGGGIVSGLRDFVSPLTSGGREAAAAKLLQEAAQNPQAAAQAAQAYRPATPGVQPTLAQATLDPGLAALERSTGTNGGADIAAQRLSNRKAILDALKAIAGTDDEYKALLSQRSAAVEPMYDAVRSQRAQISPNDLTNIFGRPAVKDALKAAAQGEANAGRPSAWLEEQSPGSLLHGQQAHAVKMALDGMLEPNPSAGLNSYQAGGVKDARAAYLNWLEREIPDYKVARTTHAWMSPEINQRDVASYLVDKLQPSLVSGEETAARLTPNAYATALKDADALARKATDFSGARLDDIMTPQQLQTIYGARSDLGREATAIDVAMTPGSPTKQNLDYQAMKDDAAGVLKQNMLARALMAAANLPGKYAKGAIDRKVTDALLNPREGARLLTLPPPSTPGSDLLIESLKRFGLPAGLGAFETNVTQ